MERRRRGRTQHCSCKATSSTGKRVSMGGGWWVEWFGLRVGRVGSARFQKTHVCTDHRERCGGVQGGSGIVNGGSVKDWASAVFWLPLFGWLAWVGQHTSLSQLRTGKNISCFRGGPFDWKAFPFKSTPSAASIFACLRAPRPPPKPIPNLQTWLQKPF